jgi:predicted ArsR family transcriptional regulator
MESVTEPTRARRSGETRILVLHYTRKGWTPREIAYHLDITTQAVHQHLARLREDGELPPRSENGGA